MEELAVAAFHYLAGCSQGVPSEVKVLKQLVDLLRQYPGGLTEAVIMNELVKVHGGDKPVAQQAFHGGSNDDTVDQTTAKGEGRQNISDVEQASSSVHGTRLPLHKLLKANSHSQLGACFAEAEVTAVHCLTGHSKSSSSSSTHSVAPSPQAGHSQAVNGVWACQLCGVHISKQPLLQLYLHTRQHAFLQPAPSSQPWLQGKRVRLSQLKLLPPLAAGKQCKQGDAAQQLPCAPPTQCLLPLLTQQQWHQRTQHLACIARANHQDSGNMLELHTVFNKLLPSMQPGTSQVLPGWLCGKIQGVECDVAAAQAVVLLAVEGHTPHVCPLVFQGHELAALAGMLQANEELAVYRPSLQLQLRQGPNNAEPQQEPVLWCMQDSLLIAAQPSLHGRDGPFSNNSKSTGNSISETGLPVTAAQLRPLHTHTQEASSQKVIRPAAVWARVHSVHACSKQDSGAASGWAAGKGGYCVHAKLQVYFKCAGQPAQRHKLDAQFMCTAHSKVVASMQAGHYLLLLGATVRLPAAAADKSGTAIGVLEWQESHADKLNRGVSAGTNLLVDLSCLPALLWTPALFLASLCTSTVPDAKQQPAASSKHTGFMQHVQLMAAQCLDQPPICCFRLKAITINVHRVHKLCGRPVTQTMDWSDMLGDVDDVGMVDNDQSGSRSTQKQQENTEAEGTHGISTHRDEHLGLWHCGLCKREVSGGDVTWALTGSACMQPASHASLDHQRSSVSWRIPRPAGLLGTDATHHHVSQNNAVHNSVVHNYHGQDRTIPSSTAGMPAGGHRTAAAAIPEVIHQVELEPAALLTLCGTSAEVWRTLSFAEQCKRVPEIRHGCVGHDRQRVQTASHKCCCKLCDSCQAHASTDQGRCLLAVVGFATSECLQADQAQQASLPCTMQHAAAGMYAVAKQDSCSDAHSAAAGMLRCVQVALLP